MRFLLGRLDLVPCRRGFVPATRLRFGDEVRLRGHRPLHRVLCEIIVIVPGACADARLRAQVTRYDGVEHRIRVGCGWWWCRWFGWSSHHWIGAHNQHSTAVRALNCREATKSRERGEDGKVAMTAPGKSSKLHLPRTDHGFIRVDRPLGDGQRLVWHVRDCLRQDYVLG